MEKPIVSKFKSPQKYDNTNRVYRVWGSYDNMHLLKNPTCPKSEPSGCSSGCYIG